MNYKIFKKINRSVFVLFSMLLGLVSCYDSGYDEFIPPTGNVNNIQPNTLFTTSTSADDTMSFVFRSYSTDAASYLWDFGDGNTSTEANPDYTYTEGGEYTVTLTTKSSDGLVAEDSSNVAPIFVDFTPTMVDSEVAFENLTSGAKALVWDFGDGETLVWNSEEGDTEEDPSFNPVHIYKTADTFEATLTATTFLNVQVSVSKNIEGLVLSTIPDFTFAVSGFSVQFTDASILAVSHSWDFGDGTTSTEVNPTHIYAGEGSYEVTLTTTNDAGVSKTITQGVPVGGVQATFAAKILNGSIDEFTGNKDDNNDAWELDPPNTLKDGSDSPYSWANAGLKSLGKKAGGITSTKNSGTYALKFDSSDRRAYQPFAVEVGVEYTISMFVRTKGTENFTVYILNNEVQDETDLTGNSDAVYIVSDDEDSYKEYTFTFTASSTTAVFYGVPDDNSSANNQFLDDVSIQTPGFDQDGNATGVNATFAAEILNGSIDEFTGNKDDNNDAWELDPPNVLKDGITDSPYTWANAGLKALGKKAGGITSTKNSGTYALKFDSDDRRAYQPFAVEIGVEYTISMFVRTKGTENFTVYILNNEVQDETDLAGNSDAVYVVSDEEDSYKEYTFTFTASSTTAVFYAVPDAGSSTNNQFLDDVSIQTPGF
ncbi:PKD domain-containing protein [Algibacter sp. L1A34]|uniref:PKD domain-containing protein n=1 Tax=Algibacter sp. L1A34 TaxID=2686365 RepID=UPI00131E3DB3|nr:PKD domain-containing protein [Algibacter sp. L1A34]